MCLIYSLLHIGSQLKNVHSLYMHYGLDFTSSTHYHFLLKVSRDGETFLTALLYLPDDMVNDIYTNHPDYKDYGVCPYNLTNDPVLKVLSDETGVTLKTACTDDLVSASVGFGIT